MGVEITKLEIDKEEKTVHVSAKATDGYIESIHIDTQKTFNCANEPSRLANETAIKNYAIELYDGNGKLVDTGEFFVYQEGSGYKMHVVPEHLQLEQNTDYDIDPGNISMGESLDVSLNVSSGIAVAYNSYKMLVKSPRGLVICNKEGNPTELEDYVLPLEDIDPANDMIFLYFENILTDDIAYVASVIFDQNALYQKVFEKIHRGIMGARCCEVNQASIDTALLFEAFLLSWSTADPRKFIYYWNRLHSTGDSNQKNCNCNG